MLLFVMLCLKHKIPDRLCGLVRPENDSPVYTVVPFSVEATDVKGLNDYFMTALDVAWALQDDSTQAA